MIKRKEDKMEDTKQLIRRLDVIIGLLVGLEESVNKDNANGLLSLSTRMSRLKILGLENSEIGVIFGKSSREVTKFIYESKRSKVKTTRRDK